MPVINLLSCAEWTPSYGLYPFYLYARPALYWYSIWLYAILHLHSISCIIIVNPTPFAGFPWNVPTFPVTFGQGTLPTGVVLHSFEHSSTRIPYPLLRHDYTFLSKLGLNSLFFFSNTTCHLILFEVIKFIIIVLLGIGDTNWLTRRVWVEVKHWLFVVIWVYWQLQLKSYWGLLSSWLP